MEKKIHSDQSNLNFLACKSLMLKVRSTQSLQQVRMYSCITVSTIVSKYTSESLQIDALLSQRNLYSLRTLCSNACIMKYYPALALILEACFLHFEWLHWKNAANALTVWSLHHSRLPAIQENSQVCSYHFFKWGSKISERFFLVICCYSG